MSKRRLVRTFGWQNVTDGALTGALRRCDMFGVSEADRSKLTKKQAPNFDRYFPQRDKNQAILWKPNRIEVIRKGFIRFHQSGQAEGWNGIPTPARGLIFTIFELGGEQYAFGEMHWLNSWNPQRGDKWTAQRRKIVEETTIPAVRKWVNQQHKAGRAVLIGGDTNSLRWNGNLHQDLTQVKKRGLDRCWVSNDPRIKVVDLSEGPITGVGKQKKHKSVILKVRLAA